MPRAKKLFELEGLQVLPFTVDFKVSAARELSIIDFLPSSGALNSMETAICEFYGRLFYWVLGQRKQSNP